MNCGVVEGASEREKQREDSPNESRCGWRERVTEKQREEEMASSGEQVFRHIVLLKLANKADKEKVADNLRPLGNGLPGVTFLKFTVVTDAGLVKTNADVAVLAEFPNKENFLAYAKHPLHLAAVAENKPFTVDRQAIQFLVPKL